MKTVMIIGLDSVIGRCLRNELIADGWFVYGTSRQKKNLSSQTLYLDLSQDDIDLSFNIKPDVVFLCASMTKVADCRDNPSLCQKINVNAQVKLAEYFLDKKTHVIFLSTTAVFSGEKPGYKIDDKTCPINVYGGSKAEAEEKLRGLSEDISIVRLTKVLTHDYPLMMSWINSLKDGRYIYPFYDLYVCPISIKCVISCLIEIAQKKLCGIIHLSGEKDISYQSIAEYLCKSMKMDDTLIKPVSALTNEIMSTEAPRYTSLDMTISQQLFNIPDQSYVTILSDLYRR